MQGFKMVISTDSLLQDTFYTFMTVPMVSKTNIDTI